MADRRKVKKRKDEECHSHEKSDKATKDEIRLAKWMKANILVKKTKFANHVVEYFTGSKAVDAIMESEWAKPKNADVDPFFRSRTDVVIFLDIMLRHKMFHRAKKVPVSEEELKAKKMKNRKEKKGGGDTGDEKKKKEDVDDGESKKKKKKGGEENKEQADKAQVKKKIRLEMHYNQMFTDGLDAYVWLYDPMPFYYWIFGFLVVIGSIGICLFPLWPPSVRMGVQYLSIAGACFIAFIIILAILRLIMFCLVWMVTFGKFHLWLFPNLTEDVGFFASFWPLYQYEFKTDGKSKKSKSSKKNKKDKQSDEEEEEEEESSDDDQAWTKEIKNTYRQINKERRLNEKMAAEAEEEVVEGGGGEDENEEISEGEDEQQNSRRERPSDVRQGEKKMKKKKMSLEERLAQESSAQSSVHISGAGNRSMTFSVQDKSRRAEKDQWHSAKHHQERKSLMRPPPTKLARSKFYAGPGTTQRFKKKPGGGFKRKA
uniref:Translocation protein SEC62 n=2 Tax=Cacopsylla melanoneura TaxID=428564 RepID=A0A8D8VNT7_9HEMI